MTEAKCIDIHGDRIAVRDEGDGEALLLIHGMAGSSQTWGAILPLLAKKYRVIAPDLFGHGQSSKPRTDYSLGAFAVGLRDLLDELKVESATVVGHSLGRRYRDAVRLPASRLLPPPCSDQQRRTRSRSRAYPASARRTRRRTDHAGHRTIASAAHREFGAVVAQFTGPAVSTRRRDLERLFVLLRPADPRRVPAHASVGVDDRGQSVSALNRLTLRDGLPALAIWGEQDTIIPVGHAYRRQSPAGLPPRSASRCRALRTSRSAGESGGTHRRLRLDDSRGRAAHGAARLLAWSSVAGASGASLQLASGIIQRPF